MPVRNESGMKLSLFPNLLSRLHDAGTKSTLFEWVNQNESRNELIKTKFKWMNQTFRGCKRYEIVPYSGVYTMPYSNQSSWRTVFISYRIQIIFMPVSCRPLGQSSIRSYAVFISYRIQIIFMPVSCRRKANPVFFHTVFISYRHRVNGV